MKADPELPIDGKQLERTLTEGKLIKHGQRIEMIAYPTGFSRRPHSRRWHYLIKSEGQAVCHLVVGQDLAPVHARAKKFHEVCPELVCRPLCFHQEESQPDLLCLEHFSGTSLDELVAAGKCTASQWLDIMRQAQLLLGKTRQPSTASVLGQEIDGLLSDLSNYPGFSTLDLTLCRELAAPEILAGARTGALVTQWSNGDFCGRNLLFDPLGGIRLIDYEYAGPTHFGNADWLRALHFSLLPQALDASQIPELKAAREPASEIWFWLHQLAQLRHAETSERVQNHLVETAGNLFAAISKAAEAKPANRTKSLLIDLLVGQNAERSKLLAERTTWAQSLETELSQSKTVLEHQTKLAEERLAWAQSLKTDLNQATNILEHQSKLSEERLVWAQSLEAQLQQARAAFSETSKLADERTRWAQSLEAELQQARSSLAQGHVTLLDLQRHIATHRQEYSQAQGAILDARLQEQAAVSETSRLNAALADAQVHIDHLLAQASALQRSAASLNHDQLQAKASLGQLERELNLAASELKICRQKLAQYEANWACRLAARLSPVNQESSTKS